MCSPWRQLAASLNAEFRRFLRLVGEATAASRLANVGEVLSSFHAAAAAAARPKHGQRYLQLHGFISALMHLLAAALPHDFTCAQTAVLIDVVFIVLFGSGGEGFKLWMG